MFMLSAAEWITGVEFAHRIGVTPRWVYDLVAHGLPIDRTRSRGDGQIPWLSALEWYIRYKVELEVRRVPQSIQESRAAKLDAEARLAQGSADRLEASLMFVDDSERILQQVRDLVAQHLEAAVARWAEAVVGADTIRAAHARLQPLAVQLVEEIRASIEELPEEVDGE